MRNPVGKIPRLFSAMILTWVLRPLALQLFLWRVWSVKIKLIWINAGIIRWTFLKSIYQICLFVATEWPQWLCENHCKILLKSNQDAASEAPPDPEETVERDRAQISRLEEEAGRERRRIRELEDQVIGWREVFILLRLIFLLDWDFALRERWPSGHCEGGGAEDFSVQIRTRKQ